MRTPFFAMLLASVILAPAPSLHATPADSLPDTTGIHPSWRIEPARPCVNDSVFMIVRGYVATPCDSFIGAEAITPLFVRIRQQVRVELACFVGPTIFYPVPLALGRFPAGTHSGIVEVVTTQLRQDGTSTSMTQQFRFGFEVAAECSIPPPPPPGALPYTHAIGTEPPRACAGQPTSLVLKGAFPSGCGEVIDTYVQDSHNVRLTLRPFALPDTVCPAVPKPWRADFPLGPLPTGPHRTNITMVVYQPDSVGGVVVPNFYYGSHEFFVYGDCDSIPSPPPGPLPYVNHIRVVSTRMCGEPICPGDSLRIWVSGVFPHDCFSFRRIQLIPSPATVVPPLPPTVRIIVDNGGCLGRPCTHYPVRWDAEAILPPMMAGLHPLAVELAEVTCSDTYPPGELHRTSVPVSVEQTCPPSGPCLNVAFAPGDLGMCNATIGTGREAELTFLVAPTVALAGLQGQFILSPAALRITRIEPIGLAAGMLIDWAATDDGARFVLFAQSGAPIPPVAPIDTRQITPAGWPVLRVTVAYFNRGGPPPERTVVTTEHVLGSDIEGGAVVLCPPPPCADFDIRLLQGRAIICGESVCDFNADGAQDVRDLVLMVHCVNGEGGCPPEVGTRFDWDGDGEFAIADVLCCARNVLQREPCPDCPPDTGQVRPEPGVAVTFGAATETPEGLMLPLDISNVHRLGAAMLTLEAPLDRYDVVGFDVSPSGDWLTLHEVRNGRIVLGLVSLMNATRLDDRAGSSFTLTLALRPGQPGGGQVSAVAGEFSGPDGVALGVNLGRPSQILPGAAQVGLSANRPNPFSNETMFTLDLVSAADVVVGIYDLRGRAIANLHRAPLGAGPHQFRWDGRTTDGRVAPNGVYFYQATVGGRSFARKLILMRGD